jgi:hypothetical protein
MAQTTKTRATVGLGTTTKRKPTKARKPSTSNRKSAATASHSSNGSSGNGISAVAHKINVDKVKTPLLAGGAAVAGAAGGLALGARQAHRSKALPRPKVKIDSHDLAKAAKSVGRFGMDMGELASELRKNREETDDAKRRSPIEVVLQGLTKRRG